MTAPLALALVALALTLCASPQASPEARTAGQMWAAIRARGWWAPLLGLGGAVVTFALVAGCMAILALAVAAKALDGARVVAGAVGWHICDLIGWAPVRLVEARA